MLHPPESAQRALDTWAPIRPQDVPQAKEALNTLLSAGRRGNSDISDFQALQILARLSLPVIVAGLAKGQWMSDRLRDFVIKHLGADIKAGPEKQYTIREDDAFDAAWEVQTRLIGEAISRAQEPSVGSPVLADQLPWLEAETVVRLANGDIATLASPDVWEVERGTTFVPAVPAGPLAVVATALAAYGAALNPDGHIRTRGGQILSVRAVVKGNKLRMEQGDRLLASGGITEAFVQDFVEKFWFWEKATSSQGPADRETALPDLPNLDNAAVLRIGAVLVSLPDPDPFLEDLRALTQTLGWPTTPEALQWEPPATLAALPTNEIAAKCFFPTKETGKGKNRHTVKLYSEPVSSAELRETMDHLRETWEVPLSDQEGIVQCLLDAFPYYTPLILRAWRLHLRVHQAEISLWVETAVKAAREELTYLEPQWSYKRPPTLDVESTDSILDFLRDLQDPGGPFAPAGGARTSTFYPDWFSPEDREQARSIYQRELAADFNEVQERFEIPHYQRISLTQSVGNQALFALFVLTPYFKGRPVDVTTVRTILHHVRQEPV